VIDATTLMAVLAAIGRLRGLDLTGYDPVVLSGQLEPYLAAYPGGLDRLLHRIGEDEAALDRLIEALTIQVSCFFRDPLLFARLEREVLPRILSDKITSSSQSIRVWSAGCATGEEPYSVAILLHRLLAVHPSHPDTYLLGTDIAAEALEKARRGWYPPESFTETRLGLLDACFTPTRGGYQLNDDIRERVRFSTDDLTSERLSAPADSIFGGFDLIMCRNVLIYFSPDLQQRVAAKLHWALAPEGLLVLGEVEPLPAPADRLFVPFDETCSIYRRLG
jgi:chemotaxis methyl-accepting protein methylase